MTGNTFFFALVPLGAGVFYFGLTIVHWQFDMICQKLCSVCAILSGLETRRTLRKTEGINFKTFIYNMLFKFFEKTKYCGTGVATEIGRDT